MRQQDASRTLADAALLAELQSGFDADQTARGAWVADLSSATASAKVSRIHRDNLRWMIKTFAKKRLLTAGQVGEDGLHLTWLLVQHANSHPRYQQIALAQFTKRHMAGEFRSANLARLTDRVAVKFGTAQPYGSLQNWAKGGVEVQNIPDLATVEANRAALGIMPLANYECMMHAVRGPAD
ncbi:hypothetical protein DES44_2596 [Roseateles depolymerans]|uniref:Uncharacterized protein n=2 Tax=Roseateles depolymerans TaxID=76731 RepID=A0A0U3MVR7_9BURK|nr:hypothetical protein RD2015_2642 [Roseateles depolymerans]REG20090.1 hypothetical protein DES44_2596 [Roseateles depolymerans]